MFSPDDAEMRTEAAGSDDQNDQVDADALVARARVVATQISVLQAEYAQLAARIAADATPAGSTSREWLCFSTGVMPTEAARSLRIGRKLTSLPGIAEAFASGAVSEGVVDAMVRVATPDNETKLLDAAQVATGAQLLKTIRTYKRIKPAPEPDQEPTEDPVDRPDEYWGHFGDNGRYRFGGDVNPELGATIHAAIRGEIDADRRRRNTAEPGVDHPILTRAEALANVFAGYLASVAAGRRDGLVPSSHQAILHLDKADIDAGWIDQAAHLHDGNAIDPVAARRMACDAAWRAVMTVDLDPEGVTREHRLGGPAQRAAAYQRDKTCCFPGCGRTAWLKLHHLDHAVAGGATRLDNLICLCQTHHTLIHKPGWQIHGNPRTGLTFTRPDGTTVGRDTRPAAEDLPPPPTVTPQQRYQATGEPLTTWALDMLLADWLTVAA